MAGLQAPVVSRTETRFDCKVAIADLGGECIQSAHLAEALQYRPKLMMGKSSEQNNISP